jgi:hypothetical protein
MALFLKEQIIDTIFCSRIMKSLLPLFWLVCARLFGSSRRRDLQNQ